MPGEFRKMIAALGFRLIDNMAQGQFVSSNSLFMKCVLQTRLDLYYRRQLFYGILYCCFQLFEYTRSYAALRAADLDWIVGPGYSLWRVHSGEKP